MKNSHISWTDHTFNPWWGCEKVSPACDSCYAESLANRWGHPVWGKEAPRRFFGEKHWNQPLKWEKEAAKAGKPALVFCASMADVFEARTDLDPWRAKLWDLIEKTPNLRWMLLTKRGRQPSRMFPSTWIREPRKNVWLGVTAENQRRADERIPQLLAVPAVVHWVSAEPLLGPINFEKYRSYEGETGSTTGVFGPGVDWVIVGGESGAKARRMDPKWANSILSQCKELGIKYHFKQKGGVLAKEMGCKNKEGKDSSEWPEELRVQEFPEVA